MASISRAIATLTDLAVLAGHNPHSSHKSSSRNYRLNDQAQCHGLVDLEKNVRTVHQDDNASNIKPEKISTVIEPEVQPIAADPNVVDWSGSDDPENPMNWSKGARWGVTLLMSSYSLITLISSSMIAPSLPAVAKELHIKTDIEVQITFSVFILASMLGPLIFAPLSEVYGRKTIVQSANLFYLIWVLMCGFSNSKGLMIASRFLSGLGASVTFGVAGGVISDCWKPEDRGKSLAIMNFAPMLGPALGPIVGGLITQHTTWRWVFWGAAIIDGILQIFTAFFFRESYGPVILSRKARLLRKATGNYQLRTPYESEDRRISNVIILSLKRPLVILTSHPVIQVAAFYGAVQFGSLYIMISSFSSLWTTRYQQSTSSSGFHYLALVIGFTIGLQAVAVAMDYIWHLASRDGTAVPEHRLILLVPAVVLMTTGLLMYGWSAQALLHWAVIDMGAMIFCLGGEISVCCFSAYIVDIYGPYSASALAANFSVRSLFAFSFPLFAPYLYQTLDYGWGNTLLACLCGGFGVTAPALLWQFGERLRRGKELKMVI